MSVMLTILLPDTIGHFVQFLNVPEYLSISKVNSELQDIASLHPPWAMALKVLDQANGFSKCNCTHVITQKNNCTSKYTNCTFECTCSLCYYRSYVVLATVLET